MNFKNFLKNFVKRKSKPILTWYESPERRSFDQKPEYYYADHKGFHLSVGTMTLGTFGWKISKEKKILHYEYFVSLDLEETKLSAEKVLFELCPNEMSVDFILDLNGK